MSSSAKPIEEPGATVVADLGTLLAVSDRPETQRRLRAELAAVRDAERKAQSETEGIRLRSF